MGAWSMGKASLAVDPAALPGAERCMDIVLLALGIGHGT